VNVSAGFLGVEPQLPVHEPIREQRTRRRSAGRWAAAVELDREAVAHCPGRGLNPCDVPVRFLQNGDHFLVREGKGSPHSDFRVLIPTSGLPATQRFCCAKRKKLRNAFELLQRRKIRVLP